MFYKSLRSWFLASTKIAILNVLKLGLQLQSHYKKWVRILFYEWKAELLTFWFGKTKRFCKKLAFILFYYWRENTFRDLQNGPLISGKSMFSAWGSNTDNAKLCVLVLLSGIFKHGTLMPRLSLGVFFLETGMGAVKKRNPYLKPHI